MENAGWGCDKSAVPGGDYWLSLQESALRTPAQGPGEGIKVVVNV